MIRNINKFNTLGRVMNEELSKKEREGKEDRECE
jgi:hypothetical protein